MKKFVPTFLATHYRFLVLVPLVMLIMPNRGLTHDTRIYVFSILRRLHETQFANDVLAQAGVQSDYTIYPRLVEPLYQVLSPWAASTVLLVLGQLIWFAGVLALVGKFTRDSTATFYGLLAAILLPATYFGFTVLAYAEPFATPRIFVEGLTFWALWCYFNRAYVTTGVLVALALALHPIMGLVTAGLIAVVLLQEDRLWWWVFGAAVVAGAAAVLGGGIVPLERITASLSGDWLTVVQERAKYLFVSQWPVKDWARILLAVSVLLPLGALAAGWQRRLIIAAAVVAAGGLLVAFLGADVLHNVLLSQMQTSRAIWFAYLFGNIGVGIVVVDMYRRSEADGDFFLFAYALAWTVDHVLWPIPGLAIGLIFSALAYLRISGRMAGIPSVARRLVYLVSLIGLAFLVYFRIKFWLDPDNRVDAFAPNDSYLGIVGLTQAELLFVLFLVFVAVRLRLKLPAVVPIALTLALTVWAGHVWDRRNLENRGLEGGYAAADLIAQIPPGSQVYWEGNAKGAWFLLGRPNYFGDVVGAGSVFSEGLAKVFLKRSRIIFAIDGIEYVDIWRSVDTIAAHSHRALKFKKLTRSDLVQACVDAPELDFLMLSREVDGAYLSVWYPRFRGADAAPAGTSGPPSARPMYLYRCADLR